MEKLKIYVVTKNSTDGTFRVGDLIWLSDNLDLNNATAKGWLSKDEWNIDGTNDFECKVSEDYYLDIIGKDEIVRRLV